MNVAIVGHGPSLKGAERGKQIDSFDKVVRLKGSHTVMWTNDYGSKVDALCATTEIMGTFYKMDAPEYWGYPKNGAFDIRTSAQVMVKLQKPLMIPLGFINTWNARFRQTASHPCVSTGMAAILISIHRWKPEKIKLFGFDTLLDPSIEFTRNNGIKRSGKGDLPKHDWVKENELLSILRETYKMEIT